MTLLRGWARDGLKDKQIAENIGCSISTLCEWKNKFPEFSEALKKGKDIADYIVENELFESCKTRTVTVKKPFKLKTVKVDGKKRLEEERIEYTEEQVVVPANVTAQIFWLKNRKKTKWSERAEPESVQDTLGNGSYGNDRLFELLAPQFLPTWQKIVRGEADEALEKGGRGSTKSSFCSIGILKLLQLHPDCNAVCIRKVGNTMRTSVYAQMQWAADQLEPGMWKCTVSPMEMTNKNTGQKILFFGLDDPGKIKSIKLPHGYIGILWFEELDQYDGPDQIRNVEQSCLRGGDFSFTFKSFNPPASPRNWANRYALEVRDRKIIQHSDYTMVPQEWLGRRFLDDAEDLKQRNLIAYNHEYLGEVTGCGKEIFTNIRAEHIDPGKFERKLHGVDWGWYPDPYAYNCMSYDAARKTLYIYDEITVRRTRNEDTFKMLQERKVMADPETERLTADSAENKSCGDYTEWGITCLPAIKGPNSVGQGIKWLQSISIVIDPVKCPDTLKEFTEYEYDADKNGDPLPGYPDHDNHHIDAVRYACESIWREPGA